MKTLLALATLALLAISTSPVSTSIAQAEGEDLNGCMSSCFLAWDLCEAQGIPTCTEEALDCIGGCLVMN